MAGEDVLHAEYATLEDARAYFADLAPSFDAGVTPVVLARSGATTGAGQFSGELEGGASAFSLSWSEVLRTCADSARVVAGNIGATAVDLAAADDRAGGAVDISPRPGGAPVPV